MGELGLEFDPLSSHVSLCGFVRGQCRLLWPFKMARTRWNDLRKFPFFDERIDHENDPFLLYVSFCGLVGASYMHLWPLKMHGVRVRCHRGS
jgi:hypothetical protein